VSTSVASAAVVKALAIDAMPHMVFSSSGVAQLAHAVMFRDHDFVVVPDGHPRTSKVFIELAT
jgi:hypothetical protein